MPTRFEDLRDSLNRPPPLAYVGKRCRADDGQRFDILGYCMIQPAMLWGVIISRDGEIMQTYQQADFDAKFKFVR